MPRSPMFPFPTGPWQRNEQPFVGPLPMVGSPMAPESAQPGGIPTRPFNMPSGLPTLQGMGGLPPTQVQTGGGQFAPIAAPRQNLGPVAGTRPANMIHGVDVGVNGMSIQSTAVTNRRRTALGQPFVPDAPGMIRPDHTDRLSVGASAEQIAIYTQRLSAAGVRGDLVAAALALIQRENALSANTRFRTRGIGGLVGGPFRQVIGQQAGPGAGGRTEASVRIDIVGGSSGGRWTDTRVRFTAEVEAICTEGYSLHQDFVEDIEVVKGSKQGTKVQMPPGEEDVDWGRLQALGANTDNGVVTWFDLPGAPPSLSTIVALVDPQGVTVVRVSQHFYAALTDNCTDETVCEFEWCHVLDLIYIDGKYTSYESTAGPC